MDNVDLRETSGVVLAYLGDSIWELNIRKYWISKGLNLRNLNRKVKDCVNAKRQSELYREIFPKLEEKFQMLGNRSKNGNIKTFPKSCSVQEYREARLFIYLREIGDETLEARKQYHHSLCKYI